MATNKKMTAKETVTLHATTLAGFSDYRDLTRWGKEHGFDSRASFTAYKRALAGAGIDYEAMRAAQLAADEAALTAACSHTVTFYTDARASAGRYAICDRDGAPVWYGRFFDGEGAEQSDAELEAALKAVWLAGRVREALGCVALQLNLMVDAQWLKFQDSPKQKGFILTQKARQYGVVLDVKWIAGSCNPADRYTTCHGYRKWTETADLRTLASPVQTQAKNN